MRIRETRRWLSTARGSAFRESGREIRESGQGIRESRTRMGTATAENDGTGRAGRRREPVRADPADFLHGDERRAWEALPGPEREEYLWRGMEEAGSDISETGLEDAWNLEPGEGSLTVSGGGGTKVYGNAGERPGGTEGAQDEWWDDPHGEDGEGYAKGCRSGVRSGTYGFRGNGGYHGTDGSGETGADVCGGNGTEGYVGSGGPTGGQGIPDSGIGQTAARTQGGLAEGTAQGARAAGDAASGGASLGIRAARKAAEAFRESLESGGDEGGREGTWNKAAGGTGKAPVGSLGKAVSMAASMVGGMFAAAAVAFFQAAVSMVSSLIAILTPVIVAVTTIATIVGVIVAAVTTPVTTAGGGGAGLVETAVSQEGNTDGSRYWAYTMGSRFVDGSSTPWCACFVSWCANERGYIDEGIFPKSGSVAAYRNFYQSRGLFRDAAGYVPRQGDLIVFGNDSHIGIVQYVEGGRVITIEGNASNAVHTRSYTLSNPRIRGYCTPDYPPEETEDGNQTETEPEGNNSGAGEETARDEAGGETGGTRRRHEGNQIY